MEIPFEIQVHSKGFRRLGFISDPVAVSLTPRFNAQGTGEITLKSSDPSLEWAMQKGARFVCRYRGRRLMSGRILNPAGQTKASGLTTLQLSSDFRRLNNTLAYVRPGNQVEATSLEAIDPRSQAQAWLPGGFSDAGPNGTVQGQYGHLLWPDGSGASGGEYVASSESALKYLVRANLISRLGTNVDLLPNLDRGGDAREAGALPLVRFQSLAEAAKPILDFSGLGIDLWQDFGDPQLRFDVWEPKEWVTPLTEKSGVLEEGNWALKDPTATRIVIGGPGEDAARAFFLRTDAAREEEIGEVIEVFKDATGAQLVWPEALAETLRIAKYYMLRPEISPADQRSFMQFIDEAVTKSFAETAATSGLSAALSESESFYYGGDAGYREGDIVTAKSGPAELTDRIMETTLSINASDGFKVTPVIGEVKDSIDRQLARAIVSLAASQRRLSTSR